MHTETKAYVTIYTFTHTYLHTHIHKLTHLRMEILKCTHKDEHMQAQTARNKQKHMNKDIHRVQKNIHDRAPAHKKHMHASIQTHLTKLKNALTHTNSFTRTYTNIKKTPTQTSLTHRCEQTYVNTHMCTRAHIKTRCKYAYTHANARTYKLPHGYTHIHTYINIYINSHTHTHIHTKGFIYPHTHTHTYTLTLIHTLTANHAIRNTHSHSHSHTLTHTHARARAHTP